MEKERNGRRRPQAGKDAHQGSDEDADEAIEKIDRLERDLEPVEDTVKDLHAQNPKGPTGNWVFSQSWNSA